MGGIGAAEEKDGRAFKGKAKNRVMREGKGKDRPQRSKGAKGGS